MAVIIFTRSRTRGWLWETILSSGQQIWLENVDKNVRQRVIIGFSFLLHAFSMGTFVQYADQGIYTLSLFHPFVDGSMLSSTFALETRRSLTRLPSWPICRLCVLYQCCLDYKGGRETMILVVSLEEKHNSGHFSVHRREMSSNCHFSVPKTLSCSQTQLSNITSMTFNMEMQLRFINIYHIHYCSN